MQGPGAGIDPDRKLRAYIAGNSGLKLQRFGACRQPAGLNGFDELSDFLTRDQRLIEGQRGFIYHIDPCHRWAILLKVTLFKAGDVFWRRGCSMSIEFPTTLKIFHSSRAVLPVCADARTGAAGRRVLAPPSTAGSSDEL